MADDKQQAIPPGVPPEVYDALWRMIGYTQALDMLFCSLLDALVQSGQQQLVARVLESAGTRDSNSSITSSLPDSSRICGVSPWAPKARERNDNQSDAECRDGSRAVDLWGMSAGPLD